MSTEHLLDIKNLKVQFQNHQILSGISFRVVRGEVIAVIGRSGSGKTVLLRTIANLIKANEGEINFHFRNLNATSPIGFVFQKSPLFPWLTVVENLTLCANGEIEKSYATDLLKNVGLEKFKNHLPGQISGGMAQKVNLLRALANSCELILMDEPFGSLDSFQRSELQQFTHDTCRSDGRSLILVTHDIDEAIQLADRILILSSRSGKIVHEIPVTLKKPAKLIEMRSAESYNLLYQQVLTALSSAEAAV